MIDVLRGLLGLPPRRYERITVVDMRTYRNACRDVDLLIQEELWHRAYVGVTAICVWLGSERHYGSKKRRRTLSDALDVWERRRSEFNPVSGIILG